MAQQEEIVLWIDRRWKNAIEKHLKDETLQEHLENVLDELCNQLPEREYERISRAIQSEAAVQRAEEEAARTYAAYHVTERGQEWYFKTSPGEELLGACKKLRGYVAAEKGTAPDKFIGMFFGGQPITAKEFDALTAGEPGRCGMSPRPSTMPQGRALLRRMNSSPNYWSCWMAWKSPRRDISPRGIFPSVMRS